jgi:hypothetical protein
MRVGSLAVDQTTNTLVETFTHLSSDNLAEFCDFIPDIYEESKNAFTNQ